ncbi:MAG: TIGR04086 family membrane protein [Clostridia bacterium]|nr:TIGR04086 family membrane protein [Clostridia bacterium]
MVKNSIFEVLKGVLISLVCSIVSVLIFAFVLRQFYSSNKVIKPVIIIIKVLVILIGCIFSIKPPKGFLKGGIIGLFATILEHLLFLIISTNISFGLSFIIDIVLGVVMGVISGIIASNLKKE